MSAIDDGGPAFPALERPVQPGEFRITAPAAPGMTLRQHYAGLAMQGFLASFSPDATGETVAAVGRWIAETAFGVADAMLAHERRERGGPGPESTLADEQDARNEADALAVELREMLDRSCAAIDSFGFRSDDYGGPDLPACIRRLGAERDELRGVIASTADRLNVALRESGCSEIFVDPYRTLAVRDGVVALYDKGARYRAENDALRARVAALETLRRFGTPFDPTGAKTGTEIMSLRGRVESLEKENVVLRRKLNPDALEDDSLDALLKENEALRTRVEMAEDMYLAQHASTDPYIRGLETRVRAAEARATELGRMNQTLADRITEMERERDEARSQVLTAMSDGAAAAIEDLDDPSEEALSRIREEIPLRVRDAIAAIDAEPPALGPRMLRATLRGIGRALVESCERKEASGGE